MPEGGSKIMNELPNDSTQNRAIEPSRVFHVDHVLYGIAVFVSAVTTFGTSGILLGLLIPAAWACVFYSRSRPIVFLILFLCLFLCLCGFLLMPANQQTGRTSYRVDCKNNLKQIGVALHEYHEVYGSFPPAYIADEDGKPMHSWRVLLLPYLDCGYLYKMYDFDEPWDGPNNSKLLSKMPPVYACPSNRNGRRETTSYVAIVGPNTAWTGFTKSKFRDGFSKGRRFSDFTDGLSYTIVVVESNSSRVPWMAPRDLKFEESLTVLTTPTPKSRGGMEGRTPRMSTNRPDVTFSSVTGRSLSLRKATIKTSGRNYSPSTMVVL
jgi:hypothetical protein